RQRERGIEIRTVRATLALLAHARADLGEDRVEVDGLLRCHARAVLKACGSFGPVLRRVSAPLPRASPRRRCTASSRGTCPGTRSVFVSLASGSSFSCAYFVRSPSVRLLVVSTVPYSQAAVNVGGHDLAAEGCLTGSPNLC